MNQKLADTPPVKYSTFGDDAEANLEHAAENVYLAMMDEEDHLNEEASWLREQRHSHKSLHWLFRPSFLMVGVCIFMFTLALSSAESTKQMIEFKLACNNISELSGNPTCDPAETQVLILSLHQAISIASGIATMIALGTVAPLSDKYGRKLFFGLIFGFQIFGKLLRFRVMSHYDTLQFASIVATEAICNLSGGTMTILALTNCYISDISEAAQRSYYLGINMAFFFVGLSVGPMAGNALLSFFESGRRISPNGPSANYGRNISPGEFAPLRFEIVVLFLLLLFTAIVLPESRSQKARRMSRTLSHSLLHASLQVNESQSKWSTMLERLNFFRPLRLIFYPKDSVHSLRHDTIKASRKAVFLLILMDCLLSSIAMPMGEILILYGIYQFGWSAHNIGYLMTVSCASRAFTLVVLNPVINFNLLQTYFGLEVNKKRFDRVDFWGVFIAYSFEAIGLACLAIAPTSALFIACLVFTSLGSIASPAINSSVIKFFPESKVGEVFGSISLVKNILSLVTPSLILAIYKISISKWHFPQATFVVLIATTLIMLFVSVYVIGILEHAENDEAQN